MEGFFHRQLAPWVGSAKRLDAWEQPDQLVLMLDEAAFHQFHGGVATNLPLAKSPFVGFHPQYWPPTGPEPPRRMARSCL